MNNTNNESGAVRIQAGDLRRLDHLRDINLTTDTMDFQKLAGEYKSELLDSVLPFWLEHSQDKQYGGYFTCLERDGSVYDTDKFIWLQGREVWLFSMLYNKVEKRPEWLECALQGAEFLKKYGHDGNYNWYFSLTRDGRPLVDPYNIFSYTFATMAFAQLAIASDDAGYAAIAKKTFDRVLEKRSNPKGKWCKAHPGTRPIKDFALPMILCNLSLEIEQLIDKQLIDQTIETCLHEVMEVFYQKDLGLIVENVSAEDNSLVDSFEGRSVNPGHSLEAMWFIMDLGKRLGRPELIDKAVELANSALGMNLMANNFTVQNDIINAVKSSPDVFSSVFSADQIASISDFNFMFLGIDLSRWGLTNEAVPTSELPAHFLSHCERIKATNGKDRVIMHCHATNLIALTYVLENDTAVFTRQLWEGSTECLVVFPDGVGILPWMVPGTDEIGQATAQEMQKHSLVLWPFHGVFGSGPTLDETFGLIDTAEKSAEVLVKVYSMGGMKQTISREELIALGQRFGVTPLASALAL